MLQRYLNTQGFTARAVSDAESLYRLLVRESFDLLILDINMPETDGLTVCQKLRKDGECLPILMLTARSDTIDRVLGLEFGADDYMSKPFEPRELTARIKALVRGRQYQSHARDGAGTVQFGEWRVNLGSGRIFCGNEEVEVRPPERALLRALASRPNQAIGRDKLIAMSHHWGVDIRMRTIDVQILRLRRLIEADHANPQIIQTVWGVGYVFVPQGLFESRQYGGANDVNASGELFA